MEKYIYGLDFQRNYVHLMYKVFDG